MLFIPILPDVFINKFPRVPSTHSNEFVIILLVTKFELEMLLLTRLFIVELEQNNEPAEILDVLLIIFTVPPPELVNNILPVLSVEILLLVFNTIPLVVFTYKLLLYRFELDTVVNKEFVIVELVTIKESHFTLLQLTFVIKALLPVIFVKFIF